VRQVPFSKPYVSERSCRYFSEALSSDHHAGDGPFSKKCAQLLETTLDARAALLTPSCTAALEMCALLLDIGPEDEVILPSYTFVSTANAWVLRGARPVFWDSQASHPNVDDSGLEDLISPRTRAIVVVHYGGMACRMDRITEIANRGGIPLIEDFAHGPFGTFKKKQLGTFGAFSTLSFHHSKNISCGEGGALLINDPKYIARAEIIREKGTDRSQFTRKLVSKYSWVDIGSSYLLSDLLAAVLLGNLEEAEMVNRGRQKIWETYAQELSSWAGTEGVLLPTTEFNGTHSAHLFFAVMPSPAVRTRFIEEMSQAGIGCPFHYQALSRSPVARAWTSGYPERRNSERFSDCLVRLPLWTGLPDADLEYVIRHVKRFQTQRGL